MDIDEYISADRVYELILLARSDNFGTADDFWRDTKTWPC